MTGLEIHDSYVPYYDRRSQAMTKQDPARQDVVAKQPKSVIGRPPRWTGEAPPTGSHLEAEGP